MNQVVTSDNIEYLKSVEAESIDMVLCSPPYDNIRDYSKEGGYTLDFHGLGEQIERTLKPGGVLVWVVQDACVKGVRSGTSFRTAIDFIDLGLNLWETLIYQRRGVWNHKHRFRVDHEYIFVFVKGNKPQYFNKEHLKVPCKYPNVTYSGAMNVNKDGTRVHSGPIKVGDKKCNGTVFNYNFGGDGNKIKKRHPAVFPDILALDFIECFCPPGGLVCDPYSGSGTTIVAANSSGRNYLGIDISDEYNDIARERLGNGEVIVRPAEAKKPDTPNRKEMGEEPETTEGIEKSLNPLEQLLFG